MPVARKLSLPSLCAHCVNEVHTRNVHASGTDTKQYLAYLVLTVYLFFMELLGKIARYLLGHLPAIFSFSLMNDWIHVAIKIN